MIMWLTLSSLAYVWIASVTMRSIRSSCKVSEKVMESKMQFLKWHVKKKVERLVFERKPRTEYLLFPINIRNVHWVLADC
jgi:hypothetical protein